MTTTFRIDDISLNTDMEKLGEIIDLLSPRGVVFLAVSPICSRLSPQDNQGWPFKNEILPRPDYQVFYNGDRIGMPQIESRWDVELASHGLVHVDHRLLDFQAQELSIVQSCSIVGSDWFVPPWHKFNDVTREVCERNAINLEEWNPGHRHAKYQKFKEGGYHYFHEYDVPRLSSLERWLSGEGTTL